MLLSTLTKAGSMEVWLFAEGIGTNLQADPCIAPFLSHMPAFLVYLHITREYFKAYELENGVDRTWRAEVL
jgi:hypothetical protein